MAQPGFLPALPEAARCVFAMSDGDPYARTALGRIAQETPWLADALAGTTQEGKSFPTLNAAVAEAPAVDLQRAVLAPALAPLTGHWLGDPVRATAFWRNALRGADFAARLHPADAPTAHAAALLRDIGSLLLPQAAGMDYAEVERLMASERLPVLEAERRVYGADHTLAGKWLAEHWGLPRAVVYGIWLHHQPPGALDGSHYPIALINAVQLAERLAENTADEVLASSPGLLQRLDVDAHALRALARAVPEEPAALRHLRGRLETTVAAPVPAPINNGWPVRLTRWQGIAKLDDAARPSTPPATVLDEVAGLLRANFGVRAGLCGMRDTVARRVEARVWHDHESPFEAVSAPLDARASDAQEERAADEALRELVLGPRGQVFDPRGMVMTPLVAWDERVGSIVFDSEAASAPFSGDAQADLLAFAGAAARALYRAMAWEAAASEQEGLALALQQTDARQRQQLRRERLAAVARMAAGASHEINNPLAVMLGRAQMMRERVSEGKDANALDAILEQGRRAAQILTDLMHFAGPPKPKLEPALLPLVVHRVVAQARERLAARAIQVEEQHAEGLPRVRIDRYQFEQVLLNLLDNAERAIPAHGGTITLRTERAGGGAEAALIVEDSGSGMRPEVVDHVFEPFFTTRPPGQGTGLGLSVCLGIVESHGGRMGVSSNPGAGTRVTVYLPVMREAAREEPAREAAPADVSPPPEPSPATAAPSPPDPETPPAAPRGVALAIEDTALREVLAQALAARGCAVHEARDVAGLAASVQRGQVALVVLDGGLDGRNVPDSLRELHTRWPEVPVVAIAGNDGAGAAELTAAGARACLTKPLDVPQLWRAVAPHLAAHA